MYTTEEIFNNICNILVQDFECDKDKLTPDVRLVEDLDLDSIDAVDLVVRLQRLVNVKINPEDFKQIRTLNDVVVAVEKIVNEKE